MEGFNATKVKMGDFEVMSTLGTGKVSSSASSSYQDPLEEFVLLGTN